MRDESTRQTREQAGTSSEYETPRLQRILVVEDDRVLCHINAMVLHHAGYYVDTVEDSASGWSALKASRYDVLITDNSMPGMTGLELVKKVRLEEMPLLVILATGMAPMEELNRCPRLHDALLLKPYTVEGILETVNKVLHQADGSGVGSQVLNGHDLENNRIPQAWESGATADAPVPRQTSPPRRILVVEEESDITQGKWNQTMDRVADDQQQFLEGKRDELRGRIPIHSRQTKETAVI
ncbi:MAG: response regulator [Verrucomicrobiota bacterium]|jgi:CheY-like chemotaxis protein